MSQAIINQAIRYGAERCIGMVDASAGKHGETLTTMPREYRATITIPDQEFEVVVMATVQPKTSK